MPLTVRNAARVAVLLLGIAAAAFLGLVAVSRTVVTEAQSTSIAR